MQQKPGSEVANNLHLAGIKKKIQGLHYDQELSKLTICEDDFAHMV